MTTQPCQGCQCHSGTAVVAPCACACACCCFPAAAPSQAPSVEVRLAAPTIGDSGFAPAFDLLLTTFRPLFAAALAQAREAGRAEVRQEAKELRTALSELVEALEAQSIEALFHTLGPKMEAARLALLREGPT